VWRRYQLDFRTPGIIPFKDKSRKQIRHKPNFRKYARERPQRWQRLCCRTANFGLRLLFSTMALRAITLSRAFLTLDVVPFPLPSSPFPLPSIR
jgi:hypothetical protein